MTIRDFNELIKFLPLSPNENQHDVVAAAFNVLATLCSYELARQHLGEKLIEVTINAYKIFASQHFSKVLKLEDCLAQTCRSLGNLCYYHGKINLKNIQSGSIIVNYSMPINRKK